MTVLFPICTTAGNMFLLVAPMSNDIVITHGVQLGSVLRPILFLLYITSRRMAIYCSRDIAVTVDLEA